MVLRHRSYGLGIILAFVLFIVGELAWIPDPLRMGNLYWIEMIDTLIRLLAAVPLLWLFGAAAGMLALRRTSITEGISPESSRFSKRARLWLLLSKAAVAAMSGTAAIAILVAPLRLEVSAGAFAAAWLLVMFDMAFSERVIRRHKVPRRSLAGIGFSLAALAVLFWPTPYMVTYPGLTMNMNRYAQAEGGSPHGSISGVLVFERPAFPADWLFARLLPHYSFERREKLGMSLGEYADVVRTLKEDADAMGSAVAFAKLGLGRGVTTHGAQVTAVLKGSPAEGKLRAGDVLVEVNGHPVTSIQELAERMRGVKPGSEVQAALLRNGERMTLTLGTRANPEDPLRAAFGIQVRDDVQFDIPRAVEYGRFLVHEGGPSHGAMLALTLIDQLTPGGVTYGNKVAGTGTIQADGTIGPIGGIEQKAFTVGRAGADVFFVPAGQEQEARKGAPQLQIVPVRTLDDILNWLKSHPKTS